MDSDHHMQMKHLNIEVIWLQRWIVLDLRVYLTMSLYLPLTFMNVNYKPL